MHACLGHALPLHRAHCPSTLPSHGSNIPRLDALYPPHPTPQAYISRAGAELSSRGFLPGVLGVFQKLLSSKAHDHEGFYILTALVEHLDMAALAQVCGTRCMRSAVRCAVHAVLCCAGPWTAQ